MMISRVASSGCSALQPASVNVIRMNVVRIIVFALPEIHRTDAKNRALHMQRPALNQVVGRLKAPRLKLVQGIWKLGLWTAAYVLALQVLGTHPSEVGTRVDPGRCFVHRTASVHAGGQSHQ